MGLVGLILGLMVCLFVISQPLSINDPIDQVNLISKTTIPAITQISSRSELPAPQIHPLPISLSQWQSDNSDDYFDQVKPSPAGYLIWSQFPIRVYVQTGESQREQQWQETVITAIQDWQPYLPLTWVESQDEADISILNQRPPLRSGELRARSAEAGYQFYSRPLPDHPPILYHRFTIWISPTQTGKYIEAAARHEFGHALGIWGHSPLETDVMYFAQVREPPGISVRDVNTLKQVYQQPTQLGWTFSN